MKKRTRRVLLCLLTLALLLPSLGSAVLPAIAATTSGYIGNMDPNLVKKLIAPAEPTVNLENSGGIRFATNINLEKYAALKQLCKERRIKGVTIGTLIAPLDYVLEAGEFSTMALGFLDYKTTHLDVVANTELFYDGEKTVAEGYDEQFVGSIVNIKLENRTRQFAAIGYIQLLISGGETFTIYSYDNQDMSLVEKYATSVADVAEKALEKDTWSEEERAQLADLAAEEQKLDINTDEVKDVRVKRNQVYFTYVNEGTSFYNRITYDGANGWRLQTNTQSYNHFKDVGAGQALALYLDEGFHDITVPLTVTQKDGELWIGARGTESVAQLAYNDFSLDFCSPDGTSLYNVNGVSLSQKGEYVLTGKMNETDAVYGGGERFDDSNHRGKTLNLYTSDSYDTKDGKGTYVAVPLFSTSRGGGMFVNRYEPMQISFPQKNTAGEWELTVGTGVLDCYFYATGNISDVLRAYVDLTGHATLPEEWAQGYIVCRFQPDFTTLEGLTGESNGVTWYYNITDIPDYQKHQYTVTENGFTRTVNLTADAVLPHKKALTLNGIAQYHYIIEDGTQDFNYNGIYNERYFLRTSPKGGQAGAGLIHIVNSLIEAGMKPTAIILEGITWYNIGTDGAQWATLYKFISYLNEQDIKTIAYTALGHMTGAKMGKNFKDEYVLMADMYVYDDENGIGKKIQSTTAIPKSDKTDNPDTVSDGKQTYIDITHPDAMKWYLNTVWGEMMKLGIDGLKVDFSESLPNEGVYRDININGTRYEKVYIKLRWHDPSMFTETEPHHAYAAYYVSAVNKYMNEKADLREDDDGFIVLARGGGIGLQRNPYMLAGDQTRRFANLSTQLAALINSGISGISFVTYDMGGYAYYGTPYHYYGGQPQEIQENNGKLTLFDMQDAEEYESEIFIRSMQYTIFGSVVKTHGDVRHIYQMTDEVQELAPLYLALHNELSEYTRELSQIACDTGMPLVRHMILEYQNDPNVADIDDQYMYGDALLVAPILTCNTKTQSGKLVLDYASVATRTVYLPAGEWIDLNTGETIVSTGQTITVRANLAKIPVYLNTASEYAEQLQAVFAGETWSAIKALANAQ